MPKRKQEEEEVDIGEIEEVDEEEEIEEEEEEVDEPAPAAVVAPPPVPSRRRKKKTKQRSVGAGGVPSNQPVASDAHLYWEQLYYGVLAEDPSIGGANGVKVGVKRTDPAPATLLGVIEGVEIQATNDESPSDAFLRVLTTRFHCFCPPGRNGTYHLEFRQKYGGRYLGSSTLSLPPPEVWQKQQERAQQPAAYGTPGAMPSMQQPVQQQGYGAPPPGYSGYGYVMPPSQPQPQASPPQTDPMTKTLIERLLADNQAMREELMRRGVQPPPSTVATPPQPRMTDQQLVEAVVTRLRQVPGFGAAPNTNPVAALTDAVTMLKQFRSIGRQIDATFGAAQPSEGVAEVVQDNPEPEKVELPFDNIPVPDGVGGQATLFGHGAVIPIRKKVYDEMGNEIEPEPEGWLDKSVRYVQANPGIIEVGVGAAMKVVEGLGQLAQAGAHKMAGAVGVGKQENVAERVNRIPHDAVDAGSNEAPPPPPGVNGTPYPSA